MKAHLKITDSAGAVFEGEIELAQVDGSRAGVGPSRSRGRAVVPVSPPPSKKPEVSADDFKVPVRAFLKRHAEGRPGHVAFTFLVARLAEGELYKEVKVEEIKAQWNTNKGLLPGKKFASMHGTRAKDEAWVDSPSRGVFVLLPAWTEILDRDE